MKDLLERLIINIFRYKFTILTLIYFCLIVTYPTGMIPRVLPVLSALSLILILNILGKTKYTLVLQILLSILVSFNAFFSFIYKSYINIGLLGSMVETNTTEAGSMLRTAWIPATIVFVISTFLIIMSCRELKQWKLNRRKSLLGIFIYIFLLSPILYRRIAITDLHDSYNEVPVYVMQVVTNHYAPLVYGNGLTIAAYANEMLTFRKYANSERTMPLGIEMMEDVEIPKKIYMILGESSTRVHYSLYGYDVPTTPFLDGLRRSSDSTNLFYYDALASASYTRNAVPIVFSTATPHEPYMFYKEKTALDLAKMAGYEVVWISNQPRVDILSVVSNYVGDIAGQANQTYFFPEGTPYGDLDLVPIIDQYKKGDDVPQFFVIHLAGSHQSYADKYREEDLKAMPASNQSELDSNPNHTMHYDRSVHYTDRVLKAIYDIARKDESSLLYYTPDHGEDVGVGHGLVPLSRMQFEVPLVVISNCTTDINKIVQKYVNPSDSLVSNASSMYILSEIMGYSVSDEVAKKAIHEGQYMIHGDANVYKFDDIEKLETED